ncbi:MAG: Ig-like domain-containing protein [Acidimicrobiales bacterium]
MVGKRRRFRRRRAFKRRLLPALVLAGGTAVVVVLAIGTVSQVSPASSSYRRTVDRGYAALVAPLVVSSNSSGTDLATLLREGPTLGRAKFFSELDALASSSEVLAGRFNAITTPVPAAAASSDCARSIDGRARALADLRSTLEGVLGGRTGTGARAADEADAVRSMSSVGTSLESDDVLWETCRRSLRQAAGSARLVVSAWVSDPSLWAPGALSDYVAAVTGSPTLAAAHRLAVTTTDTVPAPSQRSAGGILVPPTSSLRVRVVVADQGNVDEQRVEVAASVASGTQSASSLQETVDIAAGSAVALLLPALAVVPGASYALRVTATPATPASAAVVSFPVVVDKAVTIISVLPSASAVTVGKTVTYTASVSASSTGLPAASGTVAFDDDGLPIGPCSAQPVSHGEATCSVLYTAADVHAITAVYSGDPSRSAGMSPSLIEKVIRVPRTSRAGPRTRAEDKRGKKPRNRAG